MEYKVITLCGSTKFKDDFIRVQKELTLKGNIVISVGLFGHSGDNEAWQNDGKIKTMLDDIHKRKIDMSDEIYVINKNGYIGESTRLEIEYAKSKGLKINYMEEPNSCGEMEVGRCECCGRENVPLSRKYYHYNNIKCECHSPNHFILIRHCNDCEPKEPIYTKVEYRTEDLHTPEIIASNILQKLYCENSYNPDLADEITSKVYDKLMAYFVHHEVFTDKPYRVFIQELINIIILAK